MQPSPPVILFSYNRPDHLRRTLHSLMACDGFQDTDLTVYCDGARSAAQRDAVAAAQAVARQVLGSAAKLRVSEVNRGLAASIIAGVGETVAQHGRVIVLEDDFTLAPGFLTYMAQALDRYETDPAVFQVSGHMFNVPAFEQRDQAMVLPLTTTWGWATWGRAWAQFDPAATGWQQLGRDKAMRVRFNLGGVYDYATMLEAQMHGRRDSWGIRWYWSVFRQNGLGVFPPQTLVRNTGQDGSGTHGGGVLRKFSPAAVTDFGPPPKLPAALPFDQTQVNPADWHAVRTAIWHQNGGWKGRMVDVAKRLVRR